jgi:hypothetical protein
MTRFLSRAALGIGLLAPSALALPPFQADTISPGLALQGPSRSIGALDAYATLPDGDRVVFDGLEVSLVHDDGTLVSVLGTASRFGYPAFVVPDPAHGYAIVAESSAGKIRRVDLGGAGMSFLAELDFAYDAVLEDGPSALVSAAPCGYNCGSEIYRLDLLSGALSLVASVSGPSGPLARDADGNLYYGLQNSASPPQPVPILRWTKAQVEGGTLLHETDATTFAAGLDAPSSMKFDPVSRHLIVADSPFVGTCRIREFTAAGQVLGSLVESAVYLGNVEPAVTSGPGSCQAFQPEGVALRFRRTNFLRGTSEIRTLDAVRPQATMSGPGLSGPGPVTFQVTGAFPNASLIVVVGLKSTYDPSEPTYDLGTFLLHTGIDLAHARRLTTIPTDGLGAATFTFQNPGGLEGTRMFQGWIRDPSGILVGTSTAVSN